MQEKCLNLLKIPALTCYKEDGFWLSWVRQSLILLVSEFRS